MAGLTSSKDLKFLSSSHRTLVSAAAVSATFLLASCTAVDAGSTLIVTGAPQSIPAITQGSDCYMLLTNSGLPENTQSGCGSATEESEEQANAQHMLGGAGTTAKTETLAVTYYCATQDDSVTFALIPSTDAKMITASGECKPDGMHNDLVLRVPAEQLGEDFVFSSPYEFFTIVSVYEWQ